MVASVLVAAWLTSLPVPAEPSPGAASVKLSNGIFVQFRVDPLPGGDFVYSGEDTAARGFTDLASCTYFGYEIAVKPADGGQFDVRLGPLSAEAERHLRELLRGD